VKALRDAGIPSADISLVALDAAGEYGKFLTKTTTKVNDSTADGVDKGAGVGALVGGLGGLLVGLGALAIPGIGPVLAAGPLATAVAAIVGAGVGAAAGGAVGGILGGLIDLGIPEEQAHYYAEGIRRGGVLVTARTNDADTERAHSIMDSYNPVNIEERAAAWRQEGWKGYDIKAKPYTAAQITQERARYAAPVQAATNTTKKNVAAGEEARFPVVEETLAVGKRQVKGGEVRVRKYVTETPVEENVNLRQERVSVERRPVDRPASPDMVNDLHDETLEVTETHEEAVVEKKARVVEEVVVRKDVENQTQKVRDSVKRTDVQVDRSGTNMPMDEYRTNWRNHYQKNFANSGWKYEKYEPAYQYGYDLFNDKRYAGYDWNRLEPEARKTWETRYPEDAWDKAKMAVRYAWESIKDFAD
jgi:uncharacterized protein (TIGR02271 family)